MSTNQGDLKRELIPRWLPFSVAQKVGALSYSGNKYYPTWDQSILTKAKVDWNQNRTAAYATELISLITIGFKIDEDMVSAANFIVSEKMNVSHYSYELAVSILSPTTPNSNPKIQNLDNQEYASQSISLIKSKLKNYQDNPLLWSDLAYYYGVVDQKEKSIRAISIALQLGGDSDFIVRNNARALTHYDDLDKALYYVRRYPLLKSNPSVLAAEIALTNLMQKTSKFASHALSLLTSLDPKLPGVNELAAVAATIEGGSGNKKKVKKLIDKSMIAPNENSLAQVEWLSENLNIDNTKFDSSPQVLANYEALTWRFEAQGDYKSALENCASWQAFQPFSAIPATKGSYLATVALQDYQLALNFALKGYKRSPHDITVANNLACCLALTGDLVKARTVLTSVDIENADLSEQASIIATAGLIEFRNGMAERGRELYEKSINIIEKNRNEQALALALTFWYEEEKKIKGVVADKILEKAKKLAKKHNILELKQRLSW